MQSNLRFTSRNEFALRSTAGRCRVARIRAFILVFWLFVGAGGTAQSSFPALLAEQGTAVHHDQLLVFASLQAHGSSTASSTKQVT